MTAGSGIVHAEMFPLLDNAARNETELSQIWMNLPASKKMVPPHFTMLWNREIPTHTFLDGVGRPVQVTVVAGEIVPGKRAPSAPPHSWASRTDSDVIIWHAVFTEGRVGRCRPPAPKCSSSKVAPSASLSSSSQMLWTTCSGSRTSGHLSGDVVDGPQHPLR